MRRQAPQGMSERDVFLVAFLGLGRRAAYRIRGGRVERPAGTGAVGTAMVGVAFCPGATGVGVFSTVTFSVPQADRASVSIKNNRQSFLIIGGSFRLDWWRAGIISLYIRSERPHLDRHMRTWHYPAIWGKMAWRLKWQWFAGSAYSDHTKISVLLLHCQ